MNTDTTALPLVRPARRWRRRLLRSVLVLASLVVLFYVEENWRSARALELVNTRLEGRGELLTVEKLFPEIPEDQNFFAAPVIREKFESLEPGWFRFKDRGNMGSPLSEAWVDETHYNLAGAVKYLRENATWTLPAPAGKPGADILAILAPANDGLVKVREATLRPRSQMLAAQSRGGKEANGFRFLLDTARLYALRTAALLEEGRTAEACDECLQAIRFCRQLGARPGSLGYLLISLAVREQVLTMLKEHENRIPWNAAQLTSLEKELATLPFPVGFADALRGERANLRIWLDGVPAPSGMARLFPSGWKQKWMASMADLIQQKIDGIAQEGMRASIGRPLDAQWFPPGPHFALKDTLRTFDSLMRSALEADTRLLMVRVTLAATRRRLETGSWPASSADLKDDFPAVLLKDLFTSEPLRGAPVANDGFTVSSPGLKLEDAADDIELKVTLPAGASPVSGK